MNIIEINNISNEQNALEFVAESENSFNEKLFSLVQDISSDSECRAVTLAGPSCSGKTTAAFRICSYFEKMGKRARLVSIDDFYRPDSEMKALGITDFEGISAIDLHLFKSVCADLAAYKKTLFPTFDFPTRSRLALTSYDPSLNDIYIFEGIQAIYPEILDCLSPFTYKSIFINVFDGVSYSDVEFSPFEMRFVRRVVRDYYHRASPVLHTLRLWENVRKNEDINIFPYVSGSDYHINSLLPYETFIIGKVFLALTDDLPEDCAYFDTVKNIRKRLSVFSDNPFSLSMVPKESLLREFVV